MARILVIHDDPESLALYRNALPQLGHEAVAKEVAESDPGTVREMDAQVLLLDLQQPDEDHRGLGIIEQLRGDSDLRNFPIVLATGEGPELGPISERLLLLDVPILHKPFELEDLDVAIALALSGAIHAE